MKSVFLRRSLQSGLQPVCRVAVVSLLWFLLSPAFAGSPVLTLEDAWRLADEANPALRAAQANVPAAEGELRDARAPLWNNPQVSMERRRKEVPQVSSPTQVNREWSLGFAQTFEIAGQQGARRTSAEQSLAATRQVIAETRRQVRAEVESRFARVLSLQLRIQTEETTLNLIEDAAKAVGKRVAAGEDSRLDGNLARVEAERARNQVALLREQLIQARAELAALLQHWQCRAPASDCGHHVACVGELTLRWALHTEFVRYTLLKPEPAVGFDDRLWQQFPRAWWHALPGELLMASQLLVIDEAGDNATALAHRHNWFQEEEWVGAELALGKALALTDLRLYPEALVPGGASRMVLLNRSMRAGQTGRMVQRLFEIETYRMLALLALPIAKQQMQQIDAIRHQLNAITEQLLDSGDDRQTLQQLSALSAQAEALIGDSQYRFSAARAYHALVARRIEELREQRLEGIQPFSEFLQRRLLPALDTCETVSQRQERLNARLQRATALLRTRVEITREEQNQQLLSSMNRRAELQLRLQQTVEGLSVAVLTYYLTGLLAYGLKAIKATGVALPVELLTGGAVPIILLAVLGFSRRLRRQLQRPSS